jgi:hypothetical protein
MQEHVERGAQEEQSDAPLTPTEREASERPPSQPAEPDSEFQEAAADIPRGDGPSTEPTD